MESERVEFKASWDPLTTGPQLLKTICAFANDCHNLNGGYVVVGVGERDGRAVLPPSGLTAGEIDAAQKWIRGNCKRLDPSYPPILSTETVGDRLILVVWAPASEMRPHRAPAGDGGPGRFWVRLGAETVDAERRGDLLRGLIEQTARVPWDVRRAHDARVEDMREAKVREHLRDVRSGLLDEPDEKTVYRRMGLTMRVNDHEVPRNAGLLFFLEFAQTKLWLADEARRRRRRDSSRRFLTEARTLLERVVQLDASPARHAWAWRELARTLLRLRAPMQAVEDAYRRAIELLPDEPRFVRELEGLRAGRR